ncbi:MAG: cell wall metabolism sensor histidine kinase WalK [Firmicutes bacterium]|nr:cell wall metabolism sensor histidine kinase WalK [Bacillota bacterium]
MDITTKKIKEFFYSMRFSLMATYVVVILIAITLLSVYILGVLTDSFYSTEKVNLFAKANIVSGLVADTESITDETRENIAKTLYRSNMRCIITGRDLRAVFDSNNDSDIVGKVVVREAINKCMAAGEETYVKLKGVNEINMLSVAVPLMSGSKTIGAVYLAESIAGADAAVGDIKRNLIIFAVITSILIAMLSLALSFMTTAPIDNFIAVSKEISKGNFNVKAKEKGTSELVEMAKALNYMSQELEDFEQNRKKFVSDVSHELKTPLATIKLICDSIVTTDNPEPHMVQDFLGDLSDEVDRLTRLVERLLTLTKMDASQKTATVTPVDFVVMLKAIVRKLTPNSHAKNIMLYDDFEDITLEPIMLDYDKIWEAVYNVTDNAIKYTPEGGFVRMGLGIKNQMVIVTIEDNGPGIPDSEKERIFDRFYRLDDSRARDTGGTGLGLAIAKEAVVLHGGEISVKDGKNGGSIFTISIPYIREMAEGV